jgi:hypothetical protein
MRASLSGTNAVRSILLSTVVIASGCSSAPAASTETGAPPETEDVDGETPTGDAGTADATPGTSLTACELVAPADIEAALGLDAGTVAQGTLKPAPTTLDPVANECRYEGQDWGSLVVQATPTNGAKTYATVVKVYGDTGEALDVGDGGYWFESSDRGYFLKGSVMVIVQFVFIAGGTKFREPSISLGKALVAKV